MADIVMQRELYEGLGHTFVDSSSGVHWTRHVADVAALDVQLRYHPSRFFWDHLGHLVEALYIVFFQSRRNYGCWEEGLLATVGN